MYECKVLGLSVRNSSDDEVALKLEYKKGAGR